MRRVKPIALICLIIALICAGCGGSPEGGSTQTTALTTSAGNITPDAPSVEDELSQRAPKAQVDLAFPQTQPQNGQVNVEAYLKQVIASNDDMWVKYFAAEGLTEPMVTYVIVMPGQSYTMTCTDTNGKRVTVTADWPNAAYCSDDVNPNTKHAGYIYLPFNTMAKIWQGQVLQPQRRSVLPGDFAAAYITAHEFAHHIAHELFEQIKKIKADLKAPTGKFKELIADCFAGVWGNSAYYQGLLEGTDIDEAVAAAEAVGDLVDGGKDPHGTPKERATAFMLGYNSGSPADCAKNYWLAA